MTTEVAIKILMEKKLTLSGSSWCHCTLTPGEDNGKSNDCCPVSTFQSLHVKSSLTVAMVSPSTGSNATSFTKELCPDKI